MSYPNSEYCYQERCVSSDSKCFPRERTSYSCSNGCAERCRSIYVYGLIGFFAVLLALAIGLILGAVFYETILPVIAAIIAFIAALAAVGIGIWFFTRRRVC